MDFVLIYRILYRTLDLKLFLIEMEWILTKNEHDQSHPILERIIFNFNFNSEGISFHNTINESMNTLEVPHK